MMHMQRRRGGIWCNVVSCWNAGAIARPICGLMLLPMNTAAHAASAMQQLLKTASKTLHALLRAALLRCSLGRLAKLLLLLLLLLLCWIVRIAAADVS